MLPKYATISHRKSIHHRTFNLYSVSILVSIYLSLFGSYKNIISIIVERLGIVVEFVSALQIVSVSKAM